MFDCLKGRKSSSGPVSNPLPRAHQSAIKDALATSGIQVLPQVDITQFCIKASANVARAIAQRAHFSVDELDEDGKLVTALFGLVASDRLSASLNAPFDLVSSVVPMDLFGPDYVRELPRLGEAYARLAQKSSVSRSIGDNIAQWIATPSDDQLARLSAMFVVCRRYV